MIVSGVCPGRFRWLESQLALRQVSWVGELAAEQDIDGGRRRLESVAGSGWGGPSVFTDSSCSGAPDESDAWASVERHLSRQVYGHDGGNDDDDFFFL